MLSEIVSSFANIEFSGVVANKNRVQRFQAAAFSCCKTIVAPSTILQSPICLFTLLSFSISLHAVNVQAAVRSVSISMHRRTVAARNRRPVSSATKP